ncbi:glycosyltransferase [Azospirillum sp. Marseille-Q6669]
MAGLTFRWGGAAAAARRLQSGLEDLDCPVTRYVWAREPDEDPAHTVAVRDRIDLETLQGCRNRARAIDALFAPYGGREPLRYRFSADQAAAGAAFADCLPPADILNLHWMAEFLDVSLVLGALPPGLPVVWTLHDLNPLTGGCHYPGSCRRFTKGCGACPFLGNGDPADLSASAFLRKRAALADRAGPLHFVAPSRWMAAAVHASGITAGLPVTVIPNAVDCDAFYPGEAGEARRALHVPGDAAVVLFVSSNLRDPRKGLDILTAALARMEDGGRPFVLLVGQGAPPPEMAAAPHRAFGHVDDSALMRQIYAAADIVVLPTREDNLPNVVLEAFACARPVVATAVGGVPDMVESGENGWLVPSDAADALALVLREALADKGRGAELGLCGHRRVQALHTPQAQARRYLDLFLALLDQEGGRAGKADDHASVG